MTPTVFIQFLQKLVATPSVTVFFHLRPLATPSVPAADRYTTERTSIPNCFRLTIRHGYMDEIVTEDLALTIYDQLCDFITRESAAAGASADMPHTHNSPPLPPPTILLPDHTSPAHDLTPSPPSKPIPTATTTTTTTSSSSLSSSAETNLATLHKAYATQVVYIVGKEQMRIRAKTRIWRRVALSAFLWLRDNTRSKMANLKIPVERLVEVGFVKEV